MHYVSMKPEISLCYIRAEKASVKTKPQLNNLIFFPVQVSQNNPKNTRLCQHMKQGFYFR